MNLHAEKMLYHTHCESKDSFFRRIDDCGGWPVDKKYIQFYHDISSNRPCKFANEYVRDEWWTTVADSDEYYQWKLSPEAIERIKREGKQELIRAVDNLI